MRMQGFNNQYGMNQGGGPFMNNMGNGNNMGKQAMYQQQMMQRSPAQQQYAQQYMKRPYPGHPGGPNNFNQVKKEEGLHLTIIISLECSVGNNTGIGFFFRGHGL